NRHDLLIVRKLPINESDLTAENDKITVFQATQIDLYTYRIGFYSLHKHLPARHPQFNRNGIGLQGMKRFVLWQIDVAHTCSFSEIIITGNSEKSPCQK